MDDYPSYIEQLENIFKEMQENCDKTFQEKDKEESEDGSLVVRGSRDFIKQIENSLKSAANNNPEVKSEVKTVS